MKNKTGKIGKAYNRECEKDILTVFLLWDATRDKFEEFLTKANSRCQYSG